MASKRPRQYYCQCGTRLAKDNPGYQCARCQRLSRDKLIAPPEAPLEFWQTEQFREAFAAQHMGWVSRAYRIHPYHHAVYGPAGISQTLLGQWVGLRQPHLSRFETGPPTQHLDTLRHWARVLRIPAELLWFKLPTDKSHPRTADATVLSIGADENVTLLHGSRFGGRVHEPFSDTDDAVRIVHIIANPLEWKMWDETNRRTFLVQSAGMVTTVLTLIDIDRSLDKLSSRMATSYSGGIGLDSETLEGLEQATLGLRRAYRSASALSLLGPSHGMLNLLTEMAPRSGKHQDRVVTTLGQMAALIGAMLTLDLADFAAGQCYLSVAARAAQQASNNELLAFTLGARAFHVAYSGDPLAGRDYADSALSVASRGISSIMHGWLSAVASEMHAMDKNELVCRRLLDDAGTHLANADPVEPWTGVGVFNTEKLTAYLGGDLVRLGRYGDAQDVLHTALDQLGPSLTKHRCTAYVDLAEAYAAEGKIDEAVDQASSAITVIASTYHAGSLRRVEQLYRSISLHQSKSNAVRRLGEELMEMKASW
jgi:tetratricopeptide (TPR) repeat protein